MSDKVLPTPGPWAIVYLPYPCARDGDGEPNPPAAFIGPEGEDEAVALVCARTCDGEDPFDSPTQRANAALVKAAPDLLKALRDLIEDLEMRADFKVGNQKGVVDCGNGVYVRALAALAKAEGEGNDTANDAGDYGSPQSPRIA